MQADFVVYIFRYAAGFLITELESLDGHDGTEIETWFLVAYVTSQSCHQRKVYVLMIKKLQQKW